MLKTSLRTIKFLIKAIPVLFICLAICLILQAFVPVVITTTLSRFIDSAKDFSTIYDVLPLLVPLIVAFLLDSVIGPIIMMIQGEMTDKVTLLLNNELHSKINSINSLELLDDPKTYDKLELLSQEISFRPVNLLVYSMSLFRMLVTIIVIVIQLSKFNILIPIVLIFSLLPQSVFRYRLQVEAFENTVFRSPFARKLHYFSDILLKREYAKERLLYNVSGFAIDKYNKIFKTIYDISKKDRRKITFASELIAIGSIVAIATVTIYFFKQVFIGVFTIGALAMFIQYLRLMSNYSFEMIQEGALLMDTMLFMERYFEFLELEETLIDGDKILSYVKDIEFKNVYFKYKGRDDYALKNISFKIKSPEKIAIVGINGSGKSTLLKLILRLYDRTSGEILINGIDIKDYKVDSLRESFGMLFQDFSKYYFTSKENITLSEKSYDEERYNNAIKNSGAIDVIEKLPNKDNSHLGRLYEDGVDLSGGEWQKIATARAFYTNSTARIFDEPSAALDPISEKNLWEKLIDWSDNKLTIFTSHRLTGLRNADYFIVLDNSELKEKGTFNEVYKENSLFKKLYDSQL